MLFTRALPSRSCGMALTVVSMIACSLACNDSGSTKATGTSGAPCAKAAHGTVQTRAQYYAWDVAPIGHACAPEQQTRTCNDGAWSEWSGTARYETCVTTPVMLPEEQLWQDQRGVTVLATSDQNTLMSDQHGIVWRVDVNADRVESLVQPYDTAAHRSYYLDGTCLGTGFVPAETIRRGASFTVLGKEGTYGATGETELAPTAATASERQAEAGAVAWYTANAPGHCGLASTLDPDAVLVALENLEISPPDMGDVVLPLQRIWPDFDQEAVLGRLGIYWRDNAGNVVAWSRDGVHHELRHQGRLLPIQPGARDQDGLFEPLHSEVFHWVQEGSEPCSGPKLVVRMDDSLPVIAYEDGKKLGAFEGEAGLRLLVDRLQKSPQASSGLLRRRSRADGSFVCEDVLGRELLAYRHDWLRPYLDGPQPYLFLSPLEAMTPTTLPTNIALPLTPYIPAPDNGALGHVNATVVGPYRRAQRYAQGEDGTIWSWLSWDSLADLSNGTEAVVFLTDPTGTCEARYVSVPPYFAFRTPDDQVLRITVDTPVEDAPTAVRHATDTGMGSQYTSPNACGSLVPRRPGKVIHALASADVLEADDQPAHSPTTTDSVPVLGQLRWVDAVGNYVATAVDGQNGHHFLTERDREPIFEGRWYLDRETAAISDYQAMYANPTCTGDIFVSVKAQGVVQVRRGATSLGYYHSGTVDEPVERAYVWDDAQQGCVEAPAHLHTPKAKASRVHIGTNYQPPTAVFVPPLRLHVPPLTRY